MSKRAASEDDNPRKSHQVDPVETSLQAFSPGSIMRVRMNNFMSHAVSEFHFGPRMNLIVGPNGSGKSTFVCAICIALGGKLEDLGKGGMTLDQFIRTGCDRAVVTVELAGRKNSSTGENTRGGIFDSADHPDTIIVEKELIRGEKTGWTINGRNCGEIALRRAMASLHIELGNLCEFLPQDRVAQFAGLKPEQLLREFERLCGNGELARQHENLCSAYQVEQRANHAVEELVNKQTDLQQKHEQLASHAKKLEEFRRLGQELKTLGSVETYATLLAMKSKRSSVKEEYRAKVAELQKLQARIAPWQERGDALSNEARTIGGKIAHAEKKRRHADSKIERSLTGVDNLGSDIEKLDNDRQYLGQRIASLVEKYRRSKKELEECKQKLANESVPTADEIARAQDERDTLEEEVQQVETRAEEAKSERSRISDRVEWSRKKIAQLTSRFDSTDRLQTLDFGRFGGVIKSVQLVRASQKEKHLNCYEPPVVSIRVTQAACAPVVERMVRLSDLTAFTVENKFDYDKLTAFLYDQNYKYGRSVGVRTLGRSSNGIPAPSVSRDFIHSLGFDGFLVDFLDGPKPVIQMLCENEGLQNIPVCFHEMASNQIKEVVETVSSGRARFNKMAIGGNIYTFNRSSFGSHQLSTVIRPISRQASVFKQGISSEERQDVQGKISEQQANVRQRSAELKEAGEKVVSTQQEYRKAHDRLKAARDVVRDQQSRRKRVIQQQTRLSTIQDAVESERRTIKKLRKQASSEDGGSAVSRILDKISSKRCQQIDLLCKAGPALCESIELAEKMMAGDIERLEKDNSAHIVGELAKEAGGNIETIEADKQELKKKYVAAKVDYQNALQKYKAAVMAYNDEQRESVKQKIEDLDSRHLLTPEGVNAEYDRVKSSMRLCRAGSGGFSMEMLEDNEKALKQVEEALPKPREAAEQAAEEITNIRQDWEPKLDAVVKKIAADFAENLKSVASAGDVRIDKESPDFNQWKLRILVSFRDDEELVQLNAAQQSGGEKSVSTAIFLNSLQGLTEAPFRVVDEINQGMDSKNERTVHEIIVRKAVEETDASQYFLITPKLLTGLFYARHMTVHCIFAGRWCPDYSEKPEFLELGMLQKYCGSNEPLQVKMEGSVSEDMLIKDEEKEIPVNP